LPISLQSSPLIVGQQLRKGAAHSVRGAHKLVSDTLATAKRMTGPNARLLTRFDSAFYRAKVAKAVLAAGADYSVTVPLNSVVTAAVADIPADAWTGIKYPKAIYEENTGQWISYAVVGLKKNNAVSSATTKTERLSGRLVVLRIPEL